MKVYRQTERAAREDRGFVLICVLWVLAILTVITISMNRRALLDLRAATYSLDHAKAMMMARGAVRRGMVEIGNKPVVDWYNREDGATGLGQAWARPGDMLEKQRYYAQPAGAGQGREKCLYTIEDEERRISINATDERVLSKLDGFEGADVREIARRRETVLQGDGSAGSFLTVEELRYMLDGLTDKEWLGEGKKPALRGQLTCWGTGQINVNTASRAVLGCIPDLDSADIDAILQYRRGQDGQLGTDDDLSVIDFQVLADKAKMSPGAIEPLSRYCTTVSTCFTIHGVATLRQGKIRAHCQAVVDEGLNVIQWREEPIGS